MNPVVRTHTKKDMSAMQEREQEDTMSKETDCNTLCQEEKTSENYMLED